MDIPYRKIKKNILNHFRYERYLLGIAKFIKFNPYDRVCVVYKTVNYLKSLVLESLNSEENFKEYNIEEEEDMQFEDKYDIFILFLMAHALGDEKLGKLLGDIREALVSNGSVFVVDYAQPKGLIGNFFKFVLNITDKDACRYLDRGNEIFNKCGFAEQGRVILKRGCIKVIHFKAGSILEEG